LISRIYRMLIELTNGKWTSILLKKFAVSKASRFLVPSFAKVFQINVQEIEKALKDYSTLHDFFIRKLKEGSRQIDPEDLSITSPVDAVIEDIGKISQEKLIKVKGKIYSISEMLGENASLDKYIDGIYMIFYLSPSHYHRIHSPVTGKIANQWTLGNKSYPVNALGLKYGKDPLSKNYRKVTEIKHDAGMMALVKVGAMFVNSIEAIHKNDHLTKGEEMAYFSFGSTVVLLFEKGSVEILPSINPPYHIKVGEKIGYLKKADR
jgi:phosphatidylserine decarboxylase